jgi:hypothetical protein
VARKSVFLLLSISKRRAKDQDQRLGSGQAVSTDRGLHKILQIGIENLVVRVRLSIELGARRLQFLSEVAGRKSFIRGKKVLMRSVSAEPRLLLIFV